MKGHPMSKKKKPAPYRLVFGGTRKKLPAGTLKQANADARYWVAFGHAKVCIERRLPSGRFEQVKCVTRKR